jgi:hypothetical protein
MLKKSDTSAAVSGGFLLNDTPKCLNLAKGITTQAPARVNAKMCTPLSRQIFKLPSFNYFSTLIRLVDFKVKALP